MSGKTLRWTALLWVLVVFWVSTGCGGDDDDSGDDTGDDDADDDSDDDAADLTVISYNAGLARGYVPYALERTDLLAEAFAGSTSADVLCLDEVWLDEDAQAIEDATADIYPFTYRYDSHADWLAGPEQPAPCDDLTEVLDCAEASCSGLTGAAFTDCMTLNCVADLAALTSECFVCLAANVDKPIDDIADTCTNPGPEPRQYGGANGLMLLSKLDLGSPEYHPLDSFLINRGVIYAGLDSGAAHVFCTHLSTAVDPVPYLGDYGSFEGENRAQIDDLLAYAAAKSDDFAETTLLLGDFNAGPAGADYLEVYPDSYAALSDWNDVYVQNSPECTWCAENPLTGSAASMVIDHIFLRTPGDFTAETERVFDDPVTIPTADGDVEGRLSDHYGVRAALSFQAVE